MRFAATNGEEDIEAFTTTAQASSATRRLAQIICVTGYADCKTAPGYKEADTGVVKEKMRNTPKNLETALSHLCTPPPGRPVLSDAAIASRRARSVNSEQNTTKNLERLVSTGTRPESSLKTHFDSLTETVTSALDVQPSFAVPFAIEVCPCNLGRQVLLFRNIQCRQNIVLPKKFGRQLAITYVSSSQV